MCHPTSPHRCLGLLLPHQMPFAAATSAMSTCSRLLDSLATLSAMSLLSDANRYGLTRRPISLCEWPRGP